MLITAAAGSFLPRIRGRQLSCNGASHAHVRYFVCIFAGSILCGISHSSVLVMLLILLSQVCSLTGEELRRNEDARVEIQKLHEMVPVQAGSGNMVQALESAKKKLKIMKTIKQEMLIQVKHFCQTSLENK